jgi:hypothetical protein
MAMVGDVKAKGPKKVSGSDEYKGKRSKRKSYEAVDSTPATDSGGDKEGAAVAKRSTRGMRPGPGVAAPAKMWDAVENMRNAGKSFKTIMPRDMKSDSGALIDEWCSGKRKSYK